MNEVLLQAFEQQIPADGSHWRTIGEKAGEFASLSISALWLPPAGKGAGLVGGANASVGYDVYDLYDLGEFDQKGTVRTKYGTKAELLDAIRRLHEKGISVYADVVLNHMMGADGEEFIPVVEVYSGNRNRAVNRVRMESLHTRFNFPGRNGCYSSFQWNHTHFTGCQQEKPGYSYTEPPWWKFWRRPSWEINGEGERDRIFRFENKQWAQDVDCENGNFDYLMGCDIDHANPEVRDELLRWGKWFLDETHVDGFRLDAVKHISAEFYRDWWLPEMRRHAGRNLFAVGEYLQKDVSRLNAYLDRVNRSMFLFDFPLHYKFSDASVAIHENRDFDLRSLFSGTFVEERSEHAVTFVDNHDTQVGGGDLESPVHWEFQVAAYAFILLRGKGLPCVFWRDLYGVGENRDGIVRDLPRLLKIRQLSAKGEDVPVVDKGKNLVGFVRLGTEGDACSGLVCVISNSKEDRLFPFGFPDRFRGRRFRCVIGDRPNVTVNESGFADFSVGPNRCSVFIPEEAAQQLDRMG